MDAKFFEFLRDLTCTAPSAHRPGVPRGVQCKGRGLCGGNDQVRRFDGDFGKAMFFETVTLD
jgi:hypothetical protein